MSIGLIFVGLSVLVYLFGLATGEPAHGLAALSILSFGLGFIAGARSERKG